MTLQTSKREILLLCVPVAILGAALLGARWRQSLKEAANPRIDACFLRQPTAAEAYLGLKVGLTCRSSYPEGEAVHLRYSVTNSQGVFTSDKRTWGFYVVYGGDGDRGWTENGRERRELNTGVILRHFAPGLKPVKFEARLASPQGLVLAQRTFALDVRSVKPFRLEALRHTTGTVNRVRLSRGSMWANAEAEMQIEFEHSRKHSRKHFRKHSNEVDEGENRFASIGIGQIKTQIDSPLMSRAFDGSATTEPLSQGRVQYNLPIIKNPGSAWEAGAKATLYLSVDGEWPLRIEVTLPDRLPTSAPVDLPFKTGLAPMPKFKKDDVAFVGEPWLAK